MRAGWRRGAAADNYAWLTSFAEVRQLQGHARFVIAGTAAVLATIPIILLFSLGGPDRTPTIAMSLIGSGCGLLLSGLWAVRWPSLLQSESVCVIAAIGIALTCLSQSNPLVGFGGCYFISLANALAAWLHAGRANVAICVIAVATAVALSDEAYRRSGDPVLIVSAALLVCAFNIGLPIGVYGLMRALKTHALAADHDSLTGLLNRRAFQRAASDLTRHPVTPDAHYVVIVIDLDRFKTINDVAGHAAGDQILVAVADVLRLHCSLTAAIGRYGGEEFVIADKLADEAVVPVLTQSLCDRIAAIPSPLPLTASVGSANIALRHIPLEGETQTISALIRRADRAMYQAKRDGGNQTRHEPRPPFRETGQFAVDVWLHRSSRAVGVGKPHATPEQLDAAIAGDGLEAAFQPIVTLPEQAVIGYEVLARWPHLDHVDPVGVFARAAVTGCTDRLDSRCIESAMTSALNSGVPEASWLFINTEPQVPHTSFAQLDLCRKGRRLIFELTERRLLQHPQATLKKVDALRSDGCGIALDDVGADPDSLALLDVISPDVIKLDMDLVQSRPRVEQARTLAAVLAHRERTGAVILAEGIETDEHLERALAIGADLGQGFKFGRPGEPTSCQSHPRDPWTLPTRQRMSPIGTETPFDIVANTPVRTERKDTLLALSRYIESQASAAANPPMVLAAMQRAEFFTEPTRRRYRRLAATSPFVAVFGVGMSSDSASSIRGVPLLRSDALTGQWIVLSLGPNVTTALIAREKIDAGPALADGDRRFEVAITHDRLLVTLAARNLLGRIH